MVNRIIEQQKKKSIAAASRKLREEQYKEFSAQGIDKLEYEIGRLENTITHCEWDLTHACAGNLTIRNKMQIAKQQLLQKQKELDILKNGTKKI